MDLVGDFLEKTLFETLLIALLSINKTYRKPKEKKEI